MNNPTTLVIGGGLIGLTTAWELIGSGQSVEVLEAREDVGLETSYGNGAMLTAAMSDPWNSPGVHNHLVASLVNPQSPMKLRLAAIPSLLTWGLKFLGNSNAKRHRQATCESYRLAAFSIAETRKLRESLGARYDADTIGTMKLFRDERAMADSRRIAESLEDLGLQFKVLDADAAIAEEPQLARVRENVIGALRFPDDETGDAHMFCQVLAAQIHARGGTISRQTRVQRLVAERGRIVAVDVADKRIHAERVVLAAGNGSLALARTVGLSLPIRPAKGYSVTLSRNGLADWPRMPIIDDSMHAAVVPLGDRLRLVGTAEFTGFDTEIRRERIDNLFLLLEGLYPHIAEQVDRGQVQPWAGFRPMSADGLPLIGPAGPSGLFLNTGHGHLGWTHAVGSAKVLAHQILGQPVSLDPAPYHSMRCLA